MRRWSSERSAGVKMSSGRLGVIKNAPPRFIATGTAVVVVAIIPSLFDMLLDRTIIFVGTLGDDFTGKRFREQ
jgi:hypothetical protein